jgi:hypothetical protein
MNQEVAALTWISLRFIQATGSTATVYFHSLSSVGAGRRSRVVSTCWCANDPGAWVDFVFLVPAFFPGLTFKVILGIAVNP